MSKMKLVHEQAIQLKSLGRRIAKYDNAQFSCDALSDRELRLNYYLLARDYLSGRDDSYSELPSIIEDARRDLKLLIRGNTLVATLTT